MPVGFREAKAFALPNLGTGAVITDSAINGFENLMRHLAGRGGYAHTEVARRVNGLNLPILGFKGGLGGGSSAFEHGKVSTFWMIPIGPGMNMFTYMIQVRLNKTFQNVNKGSNVTLKLVLNGVPKLLRRIDWRETEPLLNQTGYIQANESISDLFKLPIDRPATMALVATFDTCDEDVSLYGTNSFAGGFSNQTFYNGINYLGFAVWRDCQGC